MRLLRLGVEAAALGPAEGVVEIGEVRPPGLNVECDPALVERVIANLVLNAVRHNEANVRVRVDAAKVDGEIHVRCTDDGRGIPEDVRESLFQEFVSGESRDDRERGPSFGLGLAFCKAAVQAHGGRIWFETDKGRGTTFVVALRLARNREAR
jgi:signal transduction histidine kinase